MREELVEELQSVLVFFRDNCTFFTQGTKIAAHLLNRTNNRRRWVCWRFVSSLFRQEIASVDRVANKTNCVRVKVTQLKLVLVRQIFSAFQILSAHFCFTLAGMSWPLNVGRCPHPEGYFRPSVGAVCHGSAVTLNSCKKFDRNRAAANSRPPLCSGAFSNVLLHSCCVPCLSVIISHDITEQESCHIHTVRLGGGIICRGPLKESQILKLENPVYTHSHAFIHTTVWWQCFRDQISVSAQISCDAVNKQLLVLSEALQLSCRSFPEWAEVS